MTLGTVQGTSLQSISRGAPQSLDTYSADSGFATTDSAGIVRDENGNIIAADPDNPAVQAQLAKQGMAGLGSNTHQTPTGRPNITDTDAKAITSGVTTLIGEIQNAINPQSKPGAAPPPDNKKYVVLGLFALAAMVLVAKHEKWIR